MAAMSPESTHAIDLPDFLAFIDGEAPPTVVAHLKHCRACRRAVEDYAGLQRHLHQRLHRATCPSSLALGEYALNLLLSSSQTRLDAHLRDCAYCAAELRWLRAMLTCVLPSGQQHEYDALAWLAD